MVKTLRPGILAEAVDEEVTTLCEVGSIGNTSIEFRYRILFGEREVATGCSLMICVGGTPGNLKPSPVPDDIRGLAAEGGGEDKTFMQAALKECPAEAPDDAYTLPLMIRHSDEDLNKHANREPWHSLPWPGSSCHAAHVLAALPQILPTRASSRMRRRSS